MNAPDVGPDRRIAVDPRREFRERKQAQLEGSVAVGDPAPSLLPEPGAHRRLHALRPGLAVPEGIDPYQQALVLRVRPGQARNSRAAVRLYHRLPERARRDDPDARCWCFTITRAAWERLQTERVLDSDGATYPDGTPCVPEGVDPLDVPVHCGTCGTTSVEILQIDFFEH